MTTNVADFTTDMDKMTHPTKWPNYPCLPVKKDTKDRGKVVGLLLANHQPIVYEANMWALMEGKPIKAQVAHVPTHTYESFDKLLADGWVVD